VVGQFVRGLLGELRRRSFNNYEHAEIGKDSLERQLALMPRQCRRDQVFDIRRDGEVSHRIERRGGRQDYRDTDHDPRLPEQ
jgi:hypothetical protein